MNKSKNNNIIGNKNYINNANNINNVNIITSNNITTPTTTTNNNNKASSMNTPTIKTKCMTDYETPLIPLISTRESKQDPFAEVKFKTKNNI